MAKHPRILNPEQCIIVVDPTLGMNEGTRYYGPFDTTTDAYDFATTVLQLRTGYSVYPLTAVQCDEQGHWITPEVSTPA